MPRALRITGLLIAALVIIQVATVPKPARALWGFGDLTTVIRDLPFETWRAIDESAKKIKGALGVASEIRKISIIDRLATTTYNQIVTGLETTGPGQKPLFLDKPDVFLQEVSLAAAGDVLDQINVVENGGGPAIGQGYSGAKLRYTISKLLSIQIGGQLGKCEETCGKQYAISFDWVNVDTADNTENYRKYVQNSNEQTVSSLQSVLNPVLQALTAGGIDAPVDCLFIKPGGMVDGNYIPASYDESIESRPDVKASVCRNQIVEAINSVYASANNSKSACMDTCNTKNAVNRVAGGLLNTIAENQTKNEGTGVRGLTTADAAQAMIDSLSSEESEIGLYLKTLGQVYLDTAQKKEGAILSLNADIVPRTSTVSGEVLTPKSAFTSLFGIPYDQENNKFFPSDYTAINVINFVVKFVNSPVGKALKTYFSSRCGLNPAVCRGPSNPRTAIGQLLFGSIGQTGTNIVTGSEELANFTTGNPDISDIPITNELAGAGLIDGNFQSAIDDTLTVREAIEKNLLDPNKAFGFDRDGQQATRGYSYRALQYLRKYRIIPVGWELAAQYYRDHRTSFNPVSNRTESIDFNLGYLVQQYSVCGQGPDRLTSPYCGLVDPDWVLKAPRTYCRRQGAGEEIISKQIVCDQNNVNRITGDPINPDGNLPDVDNGAPNCNRSAANPFPDVRRWIVTRNDNICADTQSCIVQADDGSCKSYGYCMQERENFVFNGTQCPSRSASCTSYTSPQGQTVAYLQGTLDGANCSADNAGCGWYCTKFDEGKWQCTETKPDNKILLNGKAVTCDQNESGCREFIKIEPGTNLIRNAGFDTLLSGTVDSGSPAFFTGWTGAAPAVAPDDSTVAANNTAAVALDSGTLAQTVPVGYAVAERTFTFSVRAKAAAACTMTIGFPGATATKTVLGGWQTYAVTATYDRTSTATTVPISIGGCAGLVVDSAQLEESAAATSYAAYGTANAVFLNGTRRACSIDDIGCELYTPQDGNEPVSGKVTAANRCTEEVVGCQSFTMEALAGPPARPGSPSGTPMNIVAPRADQCSAADLGCEEYTNLDAVASGGEAKEYFKSVKQCVKPGTAAEATFYSWIGDPSRGFSLRADDFAQAADGGPCTAMTFPTAAATPTCDEAQTQVDRTFCKDNPGDADCATYFIYVDTTLKEFAVPHSRTISVTNTCHPYRNSIDQEEGKDVVYYLDPDQNIACNAGAARCREFKGNTAQVSRPILTDTLEGGPGNWFAQSNVSLSSASLVAGGHSLLVKAGSPALTPSAVSGRLVPGKQYIVSFNAAATEDEHSGTVTAMFGAWDGKTFTSSADQTFSGSAVTKWNTRSVPQAPEWHAYTLGPLTAAKDVGALGIQVSTEAYIDDIILTELSDSSYLINKDLPLCTAKDVGCAAYSDRQGATQYLTGFARLCPDTMVGCRAMIDTQNSASPFATTHIADGLCSNNLCKGGVNDGQYCASNADCRGVTTPEDGFTTLVDDPKTYCPSSAKGCMSLGQPVYTSDHNISDISTVYRINNPDLYGQLLCRNKELWCQAYTTSDGSTAFFKDPQQQTCEYRSDHGSAGEWYITGTQYLCPLFPQTPPLAALVGQPIGRSCSTTCAAGDRVGKACVSSADCPNSLGGGTAACSGQASTVGIIKNASGEPVVGACSSDADCLGGNRCITLVGICPAADNGCTEYRDPNDPPGCRTACPLVQIGGSPQNVDPLCRSTVCDALSGGNSGKSCQKSSDCRPTGSTSGNCVDGDGKSYGLDTVIGIPGCRGYDYLKDTVEDTASQCNGQVNLKTGCRSFYNTSTKDVTLPPQ